MQAQPQASRLFPNGLRELLSVLFEEEQQAYSSAMQRATDRCALMHSREAEVPALLVPTAGGLARHVARLESSAQD